MAITGPTDLGTAAVDQATNAVITLPSAVAAGSAVVVTTVQATATYPTVSDSSGNTYTRVIQAVATTAFGVAIFVAENVTALSAGATITVTPGRADVSTAAGASAWTGIATTAAVEDTELLDTQSSASPAVGPVTATGEALVFAAFGTTTTAPVFTATSPYVKLHEVDSPTTFPRSFYSAYRIVASAGDYTPGGSFDSAVTWAGCAAVLKNGVPPPTTTTVRPNATTAAGGWTTGAASLHAALSDQSDATIITGVGA